MFIALTSLNGTFTCFQLMHGTINGLQRLKTYWFCLWSTWKSPKRLIWLTKRALVSPLNLNGLSMDKSFKYGWYDDITNKCPWLINGNWICLDMFLIWALMEGCVTEPWKVEVPGQQKLKTHICRYEGSLMATCECHILYWRDVLFIP